MDKISTKDLLKIYYGKKETYYIIANKVRSTNKELLFEDMVSLDYLIQKSDFETIEEIKDILIKRLNSIVKSWNKNYMNYEFKEHLKKYNISKYNFTRLLEMEGK